MYIEYTKSIEIETLRDAMRLILPTTPSTHIWILYLSETTVGRNKQQWQSDKAKILCIQSLFFLEGMYCSLGAYYDELLINRSDDYQYRSKVAIEITVSMWRYTMRCLQNYGGILRDSYQTPRVAVCIYVCNHASDRLSCTQCCGIISVIVLW
jgi:hypothetical protein